MVQGTVTRLREAFLYGGVRVVPLMGPSIGSDSKQMASEGGRLKEEEKPNYLSVVASSFGSFVVFFLFFP